MRLDEVRWKEDVRFEPDVEEAVDEGNVEIQEENHGFVEIERDGADETHHDEFVARHAVRHEHRLAGEFLVPSELPQPQGPADEDVVRARLRQEEEQEDQAEGG